MRSKVKKTTQAITNRNKTKNPKCYSQQICEFRYIIYGDSKSAREWGEFNLVCADIHSNVTLLAFWGKSSSVDRWAAAPRGFLDIQAIGSFKDTKTHHHIVSTKRELQGIQSLSNNPSTDYYTQRCLGHIVRARQEISHCKYWSLPCSYNILTSLGVSSTTNDLHIQSFPAYLQILFFQIVLINYYDRRL